MQLVLSLFPGGGLLDMAFEEAGFCIVRGLSRRTTSKLRFPGRDPSHRLSVRRRAV